MNRKYYKVNTSSSPRSTGRDRRQCIGTYTLTNKERISEVITAEKPGVVIRYDLANLYGHGGHIARADTVVELVKKPKKPVQSYDMPPWFWHGLQLFEYYEQVKAS